MSVQFIAETVPFGFFADPPIRATSSSTLIGDLVIFFLVVFSDDPITVTPTQTGFTLVSHLKVEGSFSGIHHMVYKALATSNGSTVYDFSEAFSAFNAIEVSNYVGCFVLRGQDSSWLAASQPAQREGPI